VKDAPIPEMIGVSVRLGKDGNAANRTDAEAKLDAKGLSGAEGLELQSRDAPLGHERQERPGA
jgi:hypothetical protein